MNPPDWTSFRILEPATKEEADGASTVLAEVPRSANPPEVLITAPTAGQVFAGEEVTFSWTGTDADGDALHYTVQYSSDSGASYETIAIDYNSDSLTVSRVWLAGSPTAKIKVIASDGTRVTISESAVFTVNSNPPEVFIHKPDPNRVSGSGMLVLEATAYDTEDHRLDDSAIQWTSDIDGYLGTGSYVQIFPDELSPGVHRLTATATDSSGVTGSAEVVWTNIIPRPPTGVTAVAGDRSITISWDEPAPSSATVYQYRYRPASGTWTDWATLTAGATAHTITGLTNGTTYEVVLQTRTDAASSIGILITATPS